MVIYFCLFNFLEAQGTFVFLVAPTVLYLVPHIKKT